MFNKISLQKIKCVEGVNVPKLRNRPQRRQIRPLERKKKLDGLVALFAFRKFLLKTYAGFYSLIIST